MDIVLIARRDALKELEEQLGERDMDIVVHAIDLYIDFLEIHTRDIEV